MLRKAANVTLALVVLLVGTAVYAEIPDLDLSEASLATDGPLVLFVRPDGNGHMFNQAHLQNGDIVDGTITLTLVNYLGDPLEGYPSEDLWLETTGGGLVFPDGGTDADAPTNANGEAVWLQPLMAGGCTIGEGVDVMVGGQALNHDPLLLEFVSPDINGDLLVNLSDLSLFSAGYSVSYDPCADMFFDGDMNLTDVSLFSQSYGI